MSAGLHIIGVGVGVGDGVGVGVGHTMVVCFMGLMIPPELYTFQYSVLPHEYLSHFVGFVRMTGLVVPPAKFKYTSHDMSAYVEASMRYDVDPPEKKKLNVAGDG